MARPSAPSATKGAAREYLQFVMRRLDMTASALARLAGIAPTTLTRALNDPNHQFTLSTTTLEKIREASGLDFAPFLRGRMSTVERTLDIIRNDDYAVRRDPAWGDDELRKRSQVTWVVGEVATGVWREPQFVDQRNLGPLLLVATSDYPRVEAVGLVVRGDSVNKTAENGDILFTRLQRDATQIAGTLVIVERKRSDGLVELSARRLLYGRLWSESLDPRYEGAIDLGEKDGEIVELVGWVDYVIRPVELASSIK